MSRAGLWAWFLFDSGLGTQRAKELLSAWQTRSWSLKEALDRASMDSDQLGLTPEEVRLLSPPGLPPAIDALLWDDALYPAGLSGLPIRLRPALLFYRGDPALMMRPIVYVAPSELTSDDEERLREIVNLLIDEDLLFSAYAGSAQAKLLLEELAYGHGEALLFAQAGLAARDASKQEAQLILENRLLVASPLPPNTRHRPAFTAILQQVAAAAADRMILSGTAARHPAETQGLADTPALAITGTAPGAIVPHNVRVAAAPAGALAWLGPGFPSEDDAAVEGEQDTSAEMRDRSLASKDEAGNQTYALPEEELGAPPSPEEIIETLSQGGRIPEMLRRRLADDTH